MSWVDLSASLQVTPSDEDMNAQWSSPGARVDGDRSRQPIVMIASPFPTILTANADASSSIQISGTMDAMSGSPVQNLTGLSPAPCPAMGRRSSTGTKPVARQKSSARSIPLQRTSSGGLFLTAGNFELTPSGDLHISGAFAGGLPGDLGSSQPNASPDLRKCPSKGRPVPSWNTTSKISVRSAGSELSLSSRQSSSSSLGAKGPSSTGKMGAKDKAFPEDAFLQALAVGVVKPKPSASPVRSKKSLTRQQNASQTQMNFVIRIPPTQGTPTDSLTITVLNEPNAK